MQKKPKGRGMKLARIALIACVIVAPVLGVALKEPIGTLCSICPLGFAQVFLAGGDVAVPLALSVLGFVAVGVLFGRAFCSWGCPTNAIPRSGRGKKASGSGSLNGFILVAIVLAVSLLVGFPVFCLVCPIGLVFALVFAVLKLSMFYQPTWDLVIIPLMLLVEFKLVRSWCLSFCPLGAMLAFLGKLSPVRLKYHADKKACRIESGCQTCADVCPEGISEQGIGKGDDGGCTLCGKCARECPSGALARLSFKSRERNE